MDENDSTQMAQLGDPLAPPPLPPLPPGRKSRTDPGYHQRLLMAIRRNGVRQEDLALRLGITRSTAGAILRGQITGEKHLGTLAEFLKVDLAWLMYGVNAPAWANRGIIPGSAASTLVSFAERIVGKSMTLDEIVDLKLDGDDGLLALAQNLEGTLHEDVIETLKFGQTQLLRQIEKEVPAAARKRIEEKAMKLDNATYENSVKGLVQWKSMTGLKDADKLNLQLAIRTLIERQFGRTGEGMTALQKYTDFTGWTESKPDEPPF